MSCVGGDYHDVIAGQSTSPKKKDDIEAGYTSSRGSIYPSTMLGVLSNKNQKLR